MGKALGLIPCPTCHEDHVLKLDKHENPYVYCGNFGTPLFFKGDRGPLYIEDMKRKGKYRALDLTPAVEAREPEPSRESQTQEAGDREASELEQVVELE